MAIQSQDLIIYKSDNMTDEPDGGGAATINEVVAGQSNQIMDDVSPLDRTYGRLMMRKVFPSVVTQDTDKFLGAHTIFTKIPKDGKIGVSFFSTGDHYDRREEVQSRVENYRAKGSLYSGFLWSTQWEGSRIVTIFQNTDAPVPSTGDVLYLSQNNDTEFQYIKIEDVTTREQTFTVLVGQSTETTTKTIVELTITQPLEYDFEGNEIGVDDSAASASDIRNTVVANAAKYYSSVPLATAASIGDGFVEAESIFAQVLPSSVQETAVTDVSAAGTSDLFYDASSGVISYTSSTAYSAGNNYYLGAPCLPDSLSITTDAGEIVDAGGQIKIGAQVVGDIDYANGFFRMAAGVNTISGNKTIIFTPATAPQAVQDTVFIDITSVNRGSVYTYTFDKIPEPGTVRVDFKSFGEWYSLFDNATGGLEAQDEGIGTGTINYSTGTLSITLQALPDEGSAILLSGGREPAITKIVSGGAQLYHELILSHDGAQYDTIAITWNDGIARTATVNSAGVITGDASGYVEGDTVYLSPNTTVTPGTAFDIDYDYGVRATETVNASKSGGTVTLAMAASNIPAGSISIGFDVTKAEVNGSDSQLEPAVRGLNFKDDGAGKLEGLPNSSIDYVAGTITIQESDIVVDGVWIKQTSSAGWYNFTYYTTSSQTPDLTAARDYTITFLDTGGGLSNVVDQVSPTELKGNIKGGISGDIVQGSLAFRFGGRTYTSSTTSFDLLRVTGASMGNNTFTVDGSFFPTSGAMTLTSWPTSQSSTFELVSMGVLASDDQFSNKLAFRIPNAPTRPQSLQLRAYTEDGTEYNITADVNGDLSGTGLVGGTIDDQNGIVKIEFTEPVSISSILYNAVVQQFLPLSSEILGLNPVRLPQDGRVPVFQTGDVVVILHENEQQLTPTQGTTTNLRTGVSKVTILDSGGNPLSTSLYTVDLQADPATVTWGDMTGVSMPLTVTDRIENMRVCTDVQITGRLGLSQPLTLDFPITETMVCSALVHSNVFANASAPFDQTTWTGVWSDEVIGSETLAEFNTSIYPIALTNQSTIEERWLIKFRSAISVDVIGENVGQILSDVPISANIAPINPKTGFPYFEIDYLAFGAGWSSGNCIRFNTFSASNPVWILESVAQGDPTNTDADALKFCVDIRGAVDA